MCLGRLFPSASPAKREQFVFSIAYAAEIFSVSWTVCDAGCVGQRHIEICLGNVPSLLCDEPFERRNVKRFRYQTAVDSAHNLPVQASSILWHFQVPPTLRFPPSSPFKITNFILNRNFPRNVYQAAIHLRKNRCV